MRSANTLKPDFGILAVISRLLFVKYAQGTITARSACVSEVGFYWRMLDDMDAVHASLQKEDFDLFIADCRGVSDTALSFVESLRSWQKSLPTFVICDQWELETVIRAIRLGVIDVFSCPLDEKALVAQAAKQLQKKHKGEMGNLEAIQWSELILLLSGKTNGVAQSGIRESKSESFDVSTASALRLQCEMLQRECEHLKTTLEGERKSKPSNGTALILPDSSPSPSRLAGAKPKEGKSISDNGNGHHPADPSKLAAKEAELVEIRQQLAEAKEELEVVGAAGVAASRKLKEQLADAESRAEQAKKTQLEVKAEHEALTAQLEKAESDLLVLRQKEVKAEAELTAEKKRLEEAERRAGSAQKTQLSIQAEHEALMAQLEKVESELLVLRQKSTKTEEELSAERKRCSEAGQRAKQAEAQSATALEESRHASACLEKMAAEFEAARQSLAKAQLETAAEQKRRIQLETAGATNSATAKELKERLAKAEAGTAQSQKAQVALQGELEALKAQLEKGESDLLVLRQKDAKNGTDLAAERKRAAEAELRATGVQKAQLALQSEHEALNAQLEKAESELLLLRQKDTKAGAELASEKKRAAEAEQRAKQAESLGAIAQEESRVAAAQLEKQRKDLDSTREALAKAKLEIEVVQKARSQLEAAGAASAAAAKQLEERLAKAESAAAQARQAQLASKAELEAVNAQLEKAESELLLLRQKGTKSEADLGAEKKRAAEAEQRAAAAKKSELESQAGLEALNASLEKAESELLVLRQKGAKAEAELAAEKKRASQAEQRAATVQKEQLALQAEHDASNAQLEKVESELLVLRQKDAKSGADLATERKRSVEADQRAKQAEALCTAAQEESRRTAEARDAIAKKETEVAQRQETLRKLESELQQIEIDQQTKAAGLKKEAAQLNNSKSMLNAEKSAFEAESAAITAREKSLAERERQFEAKQQQFKQKMQALLSGE